MDWLYTTGGALAFVALGFLVAALDGPRAWAASSSGRSWTRCVGVLAVLVGGLATCVFPSSPRHGVVLYFAAGVVAFAAASLAAAGAAGTTERRTPESFGASVRVFWHAAATEHRVTRYGLVVAGVAFLLAAVTGGVSVEPLLSAVGSLSQGGLLAVVVALGAVGALVPGGSGGGRGDGGRDQQNEDELGGSTDGGTTGRDAGL
ncbi:hypothetical protein [Halobacterium jilantaiense]|uniref:Uncharacterized protein n=1 Tax=Halobacterium jilantaiense TaxID=355548 RepID=A0A1I0QTK4_9EURY|nr:hypothetical protein [Halobacterium jilantaiense]SEW30605.1 hypothetical protein SAMN04487945_2941 [Halobacterium jilantaiense]